MSDTQPNITAEQRRELVLALVEALESGEYQQGTGYLHQIESDEWCCLGVACNVYAEKMGILHRVTETRDEITVEIFNADTARLPESVRRAFGFEDRLGSFAGGIGLAGMNDRGSTFAEIAALIRSVPSRLFTPEAEEQLRDVLKGVRP